ncbi:hypothetical protein JNO54_00865 [Janibacter sp. YIM B02568]|uniref:hypothetical protein n=1 Tax=Janibacter endophyticus TaxID=2806261 RepID=UPI001952396B|nr:hypothetical protein [Janibacter endophyticus]MBM6544693.1 hypothetical protein [Janibacter endophyticus]
MRVDPGERGIEDVDVEGGRLGVAQDGRRIGVGQQRLADGDGEVVGHLGQPGGVGAGHEVAAIGLDG